MKFQGIIIAALLLVPCLALRADDEGACDCPCLPMFSPCMEKVSQQCSVQEYAPAHCFKVEKIQKTVDFYKINDHSRCCSTITDENGTRDCNCNEVCCSTIEKKCAPKCCKPSCEVKCAPKCCKKPCCKKPCCKKERCCRARRTNCCKTECAEVK